MLSINHHPQTRSKKNATIINAGVNGDNTVDILSRISSILTNDGDLYIIFAGLNDARHPDSEKRLTPEQYKNNMSSIVSQLKYSGGDVLLMTFTPLLLEESDYVCAYYGQSSGCNVDNILQTFLVKVREIADEQDVIFYDLYQSFTSIGQPTNQPDSMFQNDSNADFEDDGLHLTLRGNQYIANRIVDVLSRHNNKDYNTIVCIGDSTTWGDGNVGGGTSTGDTYPAQLVSRY